MTALHLNIYTRAAADSLDLSMYYKLHLSVESSSAQGNVYIFLLTYLRLTYVILLSVNLLDLSLMSE